MNRLDNMARIFYYPYALRYLGFYKLQGVGYVNTISRSAPFHLSTLSAEPKSQDVTAGRPILLALLVAPRK
jgi:hypothetical protein